MTRHFNYRRGQDIRVNDELPVYKETIINHRERDQEKEARLRVMRGIDDIIQSRRLENELREVCDGSGEDHDNS